jgi:hypothetical protein
LGQAGRFGQRVHPEMDQNKLREFISMRCHTGDGVLVARRELRDAFQAWQGGQAVPNGLSEAMEALGYVLATKAYGPDRKKTGVYVGVGLRPQQPEQEGQVLEPGQVGPQPMDEAPPQGDAVAAVSTQQREKDLVLDNQLFGEFQGARIRKTDDVPPRISIIDLTEAVTGTLNPRRSWADLSKRFEDEHLHFAYTLVKFPGRGQNDTPVTDARGVVTIINSLGGPRAVKFRQKFADTLVRYLGGDETLIGEIRSIREAQQCLPEDHPLRVFGQTVEAERGVDVDQDDELQRALKRQKIQNELDEEIERGKNKLRAIKLQDCRETVVAKGEILDILSLGSGNRLSGDSAPPALLGMLNAARHNLASQTVAQLTALSSDVVTISQESEPALQAPPVPVITAQRVTVLEVGRDVLRLKPDKLSSAHLSKVGHAVAKRWMNTPGNGSLDQNGQNEWERTFKDNNTTRKESIQAVTADMLACHRIRFSQAYLGANEVGTGQTYNVWTYPKNEAELLIKDAFESTSGTE